MPDNMVPMVSPDGQIGDIPQAAVQAAVAKGFKVGVDMTAPDGSQGVIPMDQVHPAISKGFQFSTAAPAGIPRHGLPGNPSGLNVAGAALTTGNVLSDVGTGIGKGAEQSIERGGSMIRSATGMPQVNNPNRPELQQQGIAQKVSGGIEDVLEFVAGDEALKGLSLAQKIKKVGAVAEFLEANPRLAGLLGVAAVGARQGAVGAGQGLAHGESLPQAATTGAVTGALGGASEAMAQGVKAIAPKVAQIAGHDVPVLASQTADSGAGTSVAQAVARTGAAGRKQLGNFLLDQSTAAKGAIGSIANDVAAETVGN